VHAEADQPDDGDRQQCYARTERHPPSLAGARRGEHEEREHEPCRDLHANPRGQRRGGRSRAAACAGARAGAQRERRRQGELEQRVVVRPANREHQQHRVQADERGRPARRVAKAPGRARHQRHRAEARDDRQRLERPQPARQPQRGDRVAHQREQRPVRGVQKRPADEVIGGVGGRFGGNVRVRVQSVQRPQTRERQIAEHVL
jgi:hypothetical protein